MDVALLLMVLGVMLSGFRAGYGSVVYEDVAWDLCALNEERMKLEVQEKNTDNDAAGNDQADIEERESPQSTSEYADIGIASVLNYVNLRAEPSVESEALGKLYNNSAATVLETVLDEAGEEWYLVSSGSVENAYVKAEYVRVGDEDLARGVSTRYATVTTTTLFVRTEPGTEASVLTMLPEGEDVVVYDALDEYGWYRVSTEEGLGYVSGDYTDGTEANPYTEIGNANNALMLLPQEFVAGDGTAENTGAYLTISCKIYQVLADGTTKIYLHGDAEAFAPITVGISSALPAEEGGEATQIWQRNKKVTYNLLFGAGDGVLFPIEFATEVEEWQPADGGVIEPK